MSVEKKDVSFLLNYKDNITYINSCYRTLLERSLSPYELRTNLQRLLDGMPRKWLIYSIAKSTEFQNRFLVENLSSYAAIPLLYKLKRGMKEQIKPAVSSPIFNIAESITEPDYDCITDTIMDYKTEYDALALCQISELSTCLSDVESGHSFITVGHFATEIIGDSHDSSKNIDLSDFNFHNLQSNCDYFFTNPLLIHQLLTGHHLPSMAQSVQNCLVFTMPVLPILRNHVSAIWDNKWDSVSIEPDGSYSRWFHGIDNHGNLLLYNNSDNYKKISLRCTLTNLEQNAELVIKYNNSSKKYIFDNTKVIIEEVIYLKPYVNQLSFIYIGSGISYDNYPLQLLKFSVNDLTIFEQEEHSCSNIYCKEDVYSIDTQSFGSNYYSYLLSDRYIRSQLHKSGFFEVSAQLAMKSYDIIPLDTTRYHYSSELMNYTNYYTFIKRHIDISNQSGVIVYTAYKNGHVSSKGFDFNASL
ncbi:MAG: hypothetical protein RR746_08275 [Lachnospiraceae bacterium]